MNNKLETISNLFEGKEIISICDSYKEEHSKVLNENLIVTNSDWGVAEYLYEKETKKSAISKSNSLNYKYIDEKLIEEKN